MNGLYNMFPQSSVNYSKNNLFGYSKHFGKLDGAYTGWIQFSNFFDICFCKFRSRVVFATYCFRVFLMKFLYSISSFLFYFWFIVNSMPPFTTDNRFRFCIFAIIFASTFVSTTTIFLFPILNVVHLSSRKQMARINTGWVITFMATYFFRLSSVFKKIGYTMRQIGFSNAIIGNAKRTIPLACTTRPFPTIFVRSVTWCLINFVIKVNSTFSRKWRDFSIHSIKPFVFKNSNKFQYNAEILGVKS